jgi:hypothetical protein|tara:strand:+ start:580 stop:801 length:222 start_codon:yes stop_codon:yes gene_type:complete
VAVKDIKEMTEPLSIKEKEVAVTGNDISMSAILWAADQDEFGSLNEVIRQLRTGETDMNGLINAYMDAVGDMS